MTNPNFVSLHDYIQSIRESGNEMSPRIQWANIRNRFDAVIEAVIRSITDDHLIQPVNGANTLKVVHYTSLSTLVAILKEAQHEGQKGYLRMYSSAGFNDPDEGLYLFKQDNPSTTDVQNPFTFPGRHQQPNTTSSEPAYAYIASFIQPNTEEKLPPADDDLVFWRAYGHDGRGCSLTLTINPDHLRKVKYGKAEAEKTVHHLQDFPGQISAAYQEIKSLGNQVANQELDNWLENRLSVAAQAVAYLYKSDAYRYENECRIVLGRNQATSQSPQITFAGRPDNGFTTRYIEMLDLSTDPNDGMFRSGSVITLGPQVVNREYTQADLSELIRKAGLYTHVKISTINYRGVASRQ